MSWLEISRPIVSTPSLKGKTESRRGPLIAASLGFTVVAAQSSQPSVKLGRVGGIVYIESLTRAIPPVWDKRVRHQPYVSIISRRINFLLRQVHTVVRFLTGMSPFCVHLVGG